MVLLALLVVQCGGLFLFYNVQLGWHQYKMSSLRLKESSDFEKIRLPYATYLKCLVEDHEVRIETKMFDVKSVRHYKDSVELTLVRDHREEQLLLAIKSLLPARTDHQHKVPDYLLKLLTMNYLSVDPGTNCQVPVGKEFRQGFRNGSFCIFYPALLSPPPEKL